MNKFVDITLKIMITFFMLVFVFFIIKDCLSADEVISYNNNCNPLSKYKSSSEEISDSYVEYLISQNETIDLYNKQKKLTDENKKLHEIVSEQAKELEKKEEKNAEDLYEAKIIEKYLIRHQKEKQDKKEKKHQIKIQQLEQQAKEERDRIELEKDNESTAKNLEQVGQQVSKETNRIVQQTNNEVKRFFKSWG